MFVALNCHTTRQASLARIRRNSRGHQNSHSQPAGGRGADNVGAKTRLLRGAGRLLCSVSPLVFLLVPFCLLDKGNLRIPVLVDGAEWFFLKGARTFVGVLLASMYVELGFDPNIKERTPTQPSPQYFVYTANDKKRGHLFQNFTSIIHSVHRVEQRASGKSSKSSLSTTARP